MSSKKFVIHFVGYSCTGKSSLEKILKEKVPGSYVVAYDKQKWLLAGYNRNKDAPLIKEITKGFFEVVCKIGNPILLLGMISTEDEYESYKKIAAEYGYDFISIQLTAPQEVLLDRFRKRVENAKLADSTTISVTDEKVFLENLSKPFFVPQNIASFDTSVFTPEYVADKVLELI
jgi:predicted kinase